MSSVEPCPFCGKKILAESRHEIMECERTVLCCLSCGMCVFHSDNQDYLNDAPVLAKWWNARVFKRFGVKWLDEKNSLQVFDRRFNACGEAQAFIEELQSHDEMQRVEYFVYEEFMSNAK